MLSITDLSIRLAGRLLIDQSSVQITPGARVGMVGRNGTGKSTLFKVIRGELAAEHGTVHRQPRVGGPERPRKPDLRRAQGRPRTRRAASRSGERDRPAPDRRDPDPPRR